MGQGGAEGAWAEVLAVIVLRAIGRVGIVVKAGMDIHHHLGGGMPLVEGGQVAERLERGARLARGHSDVDVAVDLLIPIVDAAHHGQNLAGPGTEHDHRGVGNIVPLFLQRLYLLAGLLLGNAVDGQVHGGIDFEPAPVKQLRPKAILQLLADIHGKVGRHDIIALEQ